MQEHSLPLRLTTYPADFIRVSGMVTRIQPIGAYQIYLKQWRQAAGLSQDALAQRIGTTKATVSRWETGERDPTSKDIAACAQALGLRMVMLFLDPDRESLNRTILEAIERLDSMERNRHKVPRPDKKKTRRRA